MSLYAYTAYKLITKPSSYHRAGAEAHDVAKAHITTSGLRILRLIHDNVAQGRLQREHHV